MEIIGTKAELDDAYIRSTLKYSAVHLFDFDRPRWNRWIITFSDGYRISTSDPSVIIRLEIYRDAPLSA